MKTRLDSNGCCFDDEGEVASLEVTLEVQAHQQSFLAFCPCSLSLSLSLFTSPSLYLSLSLYISLWHSPSFPCPAPFLFHLSLSLPLSLSSVGIFHQWSGCSLEPSPQ